MANDSSTRELEWFDLETRMREILYMQLEPVVSKAKDDREQHNNLKIHCRNLEKRLKELESAVFGDKTAETIIMKTLTRCADIEGTLNKNIVKFTQDFSSTEEHFKNLEFKLDAQEETVKILLEKRDHADGQILQLKTLFDEHKNSIFTEMEKLNKSFQEMNKVYINKATKAEEKALEAFYKSQNNSLEMLNYKKEIDNIRKDIVDSLTMIREVRGYKLDSNTFHQTNEMILKKFDDLNFELQRQKDEILKRDSFLDKFIPLQTATMISDYLHFCSDLKTKKKVAEFEDTKLKELNTCALEKMEKGDLDDMVTKILNDMKHVEERKVELMTNDPQTIKSKPTFHSLRFGDFASTQNYEDTARSPQGIAKEEVDEIVHKIVSDRFEIEFVKFKQEMQKTIQDTNISIDNLKIQCSIVEKQMMLELQEMKNEYEKKLKIQNESHAELTKVYDIIKTELKFSIHSMNNLSQMVVCLVENAQIEQALEAQDEEDRHNMAYNFEKELQNEVAVSTPRSVVVPKVYKSTIPSANFAFQKKCASCGNSNSILSGFRTSLMYKPTPLFYRNKKFERPELIGLKGRILKSCWDQTAASLPWKHETFEKILTEAVKNSGNTSGDDTERELPSLVAHSSRSIATHYKKYRLGSL